MNSSLQKPNNIVNTPDDSIDFVKWLRLVLVNWYFFVIVGFITMSGAYILNKGVLKENRIRATVLIEGENSSSSAMQQMFLGASILPGNEGYYNSQIMLSSYYLVGKALDRLNFEVDYKRVFRFSAMHYFEDAPIKVTFSEVDERIGGLPVLFEEIDEHSFWFTVDENEEIGMPEIERKAKYGEIIKTPFYSFVVEKSEEYLTASERAEELKDEDELVIKFTYRSRGSLLKEFSKRIEVADIIEDGGSILEVSMNSVNPRRDITFLNKLFSGFLQHNLDRKNEKAIRTIQFIEEQLGIVSDSLAIAENDLQKFRTKNRVLDVSAQATQLVEKFNTLEEQKAELKIQNNYYDYLLEYLEKQKEEPIISPSVMGINDKVIAELVGKLAAEQALLLKALPGNPSYASQKQKIDNLRKVILENTRNLVHTAEFATQEINARIKELQTQAQKLPETERKLLGIQRKFAVNDTYYTFLLEKLSEAQVTKASNIPDNYVLDAPRVIDVTNQNKKKINFLIAFILGCGLPLLVLIVRDFLDVLVHSKADIQKVTSSPVVGTITRTKKSGKVLTAKYPKSGFTEVFRIMRTRLEFMASNDKKCFTVLCTSSMPGEGKSFISINTAGVYGLSGKKTVMLGFDLRKPKATSYLNVKAVKGLSSYLVGKAELSEIIVRDKELNFDFIPSGTIPPNPGELMSSKRMKGLFETLKETYEVIVVDTPPIGIVSDALWVAPYVDYSLFVIRHNHTNKHLMTEVLENPDFEKLGDFGIVVNDIVKSKQNIPVFGAILSGGKYGYSQSYGYGYNYGYIEGSGYVEE